MGMGLTSVGCCNCGSKGGSGGGGNHLPTCVCDPMPLTMRMVSHDPSCNYGMYQSCTIQYGPTPAVFAPLSIGPYCYLSTQGFPDPFAGGALFFYNVTCQYNQLLLYRLYPVSPYGSPYRDGLLYTWPLGSYGNTCDPFSLLYGVAFPGSDSSCFVQMFAP